MHPTIVKLAEWGCDTDCIHDRFLDDEEFYLSMLQVAAQDKNYQLLEQALADGASRSAFELAHALKGALGNMGLTPLYRPVCEMVELLRGGVLHDVSAQMQQVALGRQRLAEIMDSTAQ